MSDKLSGKPSRTYHVKTGRLLSEMNYIDPRGLLGKMLGRKDTARQSNMVRTAIKRREGKNDNRLAKELGMAYQPSATGRSVQQDADQAVV